eukprot:TRINITY_DN12033_c0_g1_i1.p1 TRINITY_DN12033_c0_g1~~TRINITY_DN12033_c0_g1_i1.p1  ORF type:complete len:443 (+),score=135.27 TRINITY_DN12033_c0_g1_i1:46-1374(+)
MASAAAALLLLAFASRTSSLAAGCCNGTVLKFGVPSGLDWYPLAKASDSGELVGFARDLWELLEADLGFSTRFVKLAFGTVHTDFTNLLANGTVDVLWAPMTSSDFLPDKTSAFTMPVADIDEPSIVLVRKSTQTVSLFRFLDPFTTWLWLAVIGSIAAAACVLWMLRTLDVGTGGGTDRFASSVYNSFLLLLGSDEYEWSKLGIPGRALRVGALFFVLLTVSTYTANLAAFFTRPTVSLSGPRDRQQLGDSPVCSATLPMMIRRDIIERFVFNLTATSPEVRGSVSAEVQKCYTDLQSGRVAAWIDPPMFLRPYLLNHCDTLAEVTSIRLLPVRFAFSVSRMAPPVSDNISTALLFFRSQRVWAELQARYFRVGKQCPQREYQADTEKVSFEQMSGLFIVCGAIVGGAVAFGLVRRLACREGHEGGEEPPTPAAAQLQAST